MYRIFIKSFIISVLLLPSAGCDWVQKMNSPNSNVEDKTRETLGLKKTGIPECDEVVDILTRKTKGNTNNQEESWADKATTELIKQQIYNYVNESNSNRSPKEKAELAGKCKTALGYLKDDSKK